MFNTQWSTNTTIKNFIVIILSGLKKQTRSFLISTGFLLLR